MIFPAAWTRPGVFQKGKSVTDRLALLFPAAWSRPGVLQKGKSVTDLPF